MSFQTGSIDKNGLARTEDGKLYVTSVGTAAITGGTISNSTTGVVGFVGQSFVAVSGAADTNENTLATVAIPANIGIGASVRVTCAFSITSSANNKTLRIKADGTAIYSAVVTAQSYVSASASIGNAASVSAQNSIVNWQINAASSVGTAATTINTASTWNITITGQKASAGETITLLGYTVEVLH
jgi:hypothetical protein